MGGGGRGGSTGTLQVVRGVKSFGGWVCLGFLLGVVQAKTYGTHVLVQQILRYCTVQ
jgi:hypothetical protein